jgi:membrane protease YdiL (CAAX protease family)
MNLFDDNPSIQPNGNPREQSTSGEPAELPTAVQPAEEPLAGDPLSYVAITPAAHVPPENLPEDLRISWSWPHLLVFFGFVVVSQLAIVILIMGFYSTQKHVSREKLAKLLESDPKLIIGTNVLWFAMIILFLYVTLALLRDMPFWESLGWKKLKSSARDGKGRPWMYFLSGCGLSIFVAVASSQVKDSEHAPIQEFLKNRSGALSLMAMAVLVAPFVEETIFRGYLYPVLARIASSICRFYGMEFSRATRTGVATSILLTGTLFGLMHAPQLGWTWGLVGLLTLVGVIFTFARAWTGTVLASFLLHLGYNSMIAFTSIVATKGFTHFPPHP